MYFCRFVSSNLEYDIIRHMGASSVESYISGHEVKVIFHLIVRIWYCARVLKFFSNTPHESIDLEMGRDKIDQLTCEWTDTILSVAVKGLCCL